MKSKLLTVASRVMHDLSPALSAQQPSLFPVPSTQLFHPFPILWPGPSDCLERSRGLLLEASHPSFSPITPFVFPKRVLSNVQWYPPIQRSLPTWLWGPWGQHPPWYAPVGLALTKYSLYFFNQDSPRPTEYFSGWIKGTRNNGIINIVKGHATRHICRQK